MLHIKDVRLSAFHICSAFIKYSAKFAALGLFCSSLALSAEPGLRVVIQLNDSNPTNINNGMKSIINLYDKAQATGTPLEARVVVFGPALGFFKKKMPQELAESYSKLRDLAGVKVTGITLSACEVTLKNNRRQSIELPQGFKTVPSGAFEVVNLQRQGFQYLRP